MSNYQDLNPEDQEYLTSNLVFNNLTYNTENMTLATGISATTTPLVALDGQGRAYLQGKVTINTASVQNDMHLCSLPIKLTPQLDTYHPVVVLRSGALINNAVIVESGGSSISGINFGNPGVYAAIPSLSTSGPGVGATFIPLMGAVAFTIQAAGTGYMPGDLLTGTGGTASTQFLAVVGSTKVVSATITAGGTGGTTGTQTVTGTTGTGTKFQASVTVSGGGAITAVLSITVGGSYTVNPTTLTAEPVTGAGLTGAQLSVVMGVASTGVIVTPGSYSALPTNPITTTSQHGTGCTVNGQWGLISPTVTAGGTGYTTDSTVVITGGSPVTPGSGTLVLGASSNGLVSLVTQPNQNDIVHLDNVAFLVDAYN